MPEPLKLLSTLGVLGVMQQVLPPYEAAGHAITAEYDPTAAILARIKAGARGDVAILTGEGIEALTEAGILQPGTRLDLAKSYVGMAVLAGAPKPDIATPEACIATLRAAKTIAYSKAGASGIFFAGLLERLGIATEINAKATIIPNGFTAQRLVDGEVELAVQQVSELMAIPGVDIVGLLPAALNTEVVFAAALFAGTPQAVEGAALLSHFKAACTPGLLRAKGLEPA